MAGVIVPRKTVGEIRKLLDDTSTDNITIALSENKIRFTMEDVTLTSKLIDGTYPDYERVIPTDNDKVLELGVKELSSAVDRVSVVAERTRAIKMITNKNHVTITTSSPDLGSAMEEVEAKYDSESLEIGYNFRLPFMPKIGMEKMRVFMTGYNLLTFDKLKISDPESMSSGVPQYPVMRVINFGLNVSF